MTMNRRTFSKSLLVGAAAGSMRFEKTASTPDGFITDVAGVQVGHFTDARRPTGCTVILTTEGAVGGVDVRGSAPGTRETDLLDPSNLVQKVHAVALCGGSAFGLAAANGVMTFLQERGHGFETTHGLIPIVPAAVI